MLDPSLQALLKDVDISLARHKNSNPHTHRELDIIPSESIEEGLIATRGREDSDSEDSLARKSPAAIFGSQGIGTIVLPLELQNSINVLISDSDKTSLRNDAKRLFQGEVDKGDAEWTSSYEAKYRSRHQALRHSERDGTAFASIALPAHYSAIRAVLAHVKHRLGPDWGITNVIDWGVATGSGLWASIHTFQKNVDVSQDVEDLKLSDTSLETYLGIDKRDGLVNIGKRLLRNVKGGNFTVTWQRAFHDDDRVPRLLGQSTLALSAFNLSSLPTNLARKSLVKEMWESGANTIILIDHNTASGFENIAEARELLLKMGRKEIEDPSTEDWPIRGSHVIAPCPHDSECPLLHPGSMRLVCGFSQRLQRPSFIRLTKHSTVGHEDTGYSYVVIQRGERPARPLTKVGRIGAVGKRELDKAAESQTIMKELSLHDEDEIVAEEPPEPPSSASSSNSVLSPLDSEIQVQLQREAYSWPRLVFPPLKKSGHIILDACTPEGKIMRLTIPKSQGKQPYYDARKSSWGDIFPHSPKNPPQERYQPRRGKRDSATSPVKGADIGKRRNTKEQNRISYENLSDDIKETRKKSKRDRISHEGLRTSFN
ncbi:mitochondrial small ribosomal subunit Rsm22-domain-containing protein [Lentinula raphanica]|nr:mitochondrial small ribosomal subunit Rsm22-domain-containing protein [Lentinula raphanica]KAJ3762181.1 mitochondrial small ribosomal subunit Rsm22-domain-containing protein [Lentinula raphanica]KAJ3767336.1 mitochondrial small ribosomal subunit Rsm22-domain-containing protein [Lentinula raphanica]